MINLMVVMVLGGLWHGAGWTFLIWGAIHGTMLAAERWTRSRHDNSQDVPSARQVPMILITFLVVCLAWVFFRAPDLASAAEIVGRIISMRSGEVVWGAVIWVAVASVVFLLTDLVERRMQLSGPSRAPLRSIPTGLVVGVAIAALLVTSGGDPVPFIYFRF